MNAAFFESEIRRLENLIIRLDERCRAADDVCIGFLRRLVALERKDHRRDIGAIKLRVTDTKPEKP